MNRGRIILPPAISPVWPTAALVISAVTNLQSLVEIGVDKNTTVVFPAPLMTIIAELGSFLAAEKAAARPPPARRRRSHVLRR